MKNKTYIFIKNCYNNCNGIDYDCEICQGDKPFLEPPYICAWYQTIQSDLEKIKHGDKCLNFPDLEKIIKEE